MPKFANPPQPRTTTDGFLQYGSQTIVVTHGNTSTTYIADDIQASADSKVLVRKDISGVPAATTQINQLVVGTMTIQVPSSRTVPVRGSAFVLTNVDGTQLTCRIKKITLLEKADAETKFKVDFFQDLDLVLLVYGSQQVTINSVVYLADDIEINFDSTVLIRKDQLGAPAADRLISTLPTGTMTLQIPAQVIQPGVGQGFQLTNVNGVQSNFAVKKVSELFHSDSENKLKVDFVLSLQGQSLFYGSQIITIGTAQYIADDLQVSQPLKQVVRYDSNHLPTGQAFTYELFSGSATLQVPASSILPVLGTPFTFLHANGAVMNAWVTKLGARFTASGETKIPISFAQKIYN